ncbi:SH3 domain-binding protein 5-like isoform X2 [Zophobas morio]
MPEKNLDPRIRVYLEKLNAASDRVNDIESMLESLRGRHRQLIQEGIKKLKATLSRDGMRATLKKADPYYLTVKERDKVSSEVGLLAQQYKKASDALLKAQTESWSYEKSLYSEKSLGASVKVDPEKQEQLNNLNLKVEECQENKLKAERAYKNGLAKVESLRLKEDYHLANLGPCINKANKYLKLKKELETEVDKVQLEVSKLTAEGSIARKEVAECLKALSDLSLELKKEDGKRRGYLNANPHQLRRSRSDDRDWSPQIFDIPPEISDDLKKDASVSVSYNNLIQSSLESFPTSE